MANGYAKPNYTQLPNALFDHHLPQMKEAELKVVMAIARATFGWHKTSDKLSLSQLMEKTGLTRQGVINGVQDGIDRGVISREQDGMGFVYSLVIEDEVVNEVDQLKVVNQVDQSTKLTSTSQRSRPPLVNEVDQLPPKLVNEVDTQKKVTTKERVKERVKENPTHPPTPSHNNNGMGGDGFEPPENFTDVQLWLYGLLTDPDIDVSPAKVPDCLSLLSLDGVLRRVAAWWHDNRYTNDPAQRPGTGALVTRLLNPKKFHAGPMSPEFIDSALYRRHYASLEVMADPPEWFCDLPSPPRGNRFQNADGGTVELVFAGRGW